MQAMPKDPFDAVRTLGRDFPGVEESLYFGQPALKTGGRMFACMASHSSAEPGSLVVRVDFARREELLAEAPEIFYITPHYDAYPAVVVRLSKIPPDMLRGLLAGALQLVRRPPRKRGK